MQDVTPVKNDLFGVWFASESSMQFTIHNTNGVGEIAKFTDFNKNSERFLKVEMPGIYETYKIASISAANMHLLNSHSDTIRFIRMGN